MLGGLRNAFRPRRNSSALDDNSSSSSSSSSGDELAPGDPHPAPRTRRSSSIRQAFTNAASLGRRNRGSRSSRGSLGPVPSASSAANAPRASPPKAAPLSLKPHRLAARALTPPIESRSSISALSARHSVQAKPSHSHANGAAHRDLSEKHSHANGGGHRELAEKLVQQEKTSAAVRPSLPHFTAAVMAPHVLQAKIGEGAFSQVYHARDKRNGANVAVKVVNKAELTPTQKASVLKEVQIMRNLQHPSIIHLLQFGESEEHYFLVLEWANGGEIFERIASLTYFSEPLSRHVITQVAHAIRYLHQEKGVVHRDIKPENLLFEEIPFIPSDREVLRQHRLQHPYDHGKADEGIFTDGLGGGGIGRVKLADFGLSKVVWEQFTTTPCGTAGYTAPEIVKDQRYSKSVDMWALGCVLYTLLCGFPPFYDESIPVLTDKVSRGEYEFLSPWWDDVSDSAKDLIRHLLTVNPEERYTIDQFFEHPWCQTRPGNLASTRWRMPAARSPAPSIRSEKSFHSAIPSATHSMRDEAHLPLPEGSATGVDSPLLANHGGRRPLPGAAQLREAFDVSYALHRQEEEAQHRKSMGYAAMPSVLRELEEADEDKDEDDQVARAEWRYGADSDAALAVRRGSAAAQDTMKAAALAVQAQTPQTERSVGDAEDSAIGTPASTFTADRKPKWSPLTKLSTKPAPTFELHLTNATLLERRKEQRA